MELNRQPRQIKHNHRGKKMSAACFMFRIPLLAITVLLPLENAHAVTWNRSTVSNLAALVIDIDSEFCSQPDRNGTNWNNSGGPWSAPDEDGITWNNVGVPGANNSDSQSLDDFFGQNDSNCYDLPDPPFSQYDLASLTGWKERATSPFSHFALLETNLLNIVIDSPLLLNGGGVSEDANLQLSELLRHPFEQLVSAVPNTRSNLTYTFEVMPTSSDGNFFYAEHEVEGSMVTVRVSAGLARWRGQI